MNTLVIFDGVIQFDYKSASLCNINQPEKIVGLYSPTNKCLSLLIESYPEIISQHVFFEKIWENDGVKITANTFYQHIAMLRRAFEDVGYENEVIITIPRRGVGISKDITLTFSDYPKTKKGDITEKKNKLLPCFHPKVLNGIFDTRKKIILISLFLTFLLAVFFSTTWMLSNKNVNTDYLSKYLHIGHVNKCEIFILSSLTTFDDVRSDIAKNEIDCNVTKDIYYSTNPLLKRVSIISCSVQRVEDSRNCTSYFPAKSE